MKPSARGWRTTVEPRARLPQAGEGAVQSFVNVSRKVGARLGHTHLCFFLAHSMRTMLDSALLWITDDSGTATWTTTTGPRGQWAVDGRRTSPQAGRTCRRGYGRVKLNRGCNGVERSGGLWVLCLRPFFTSPWPGPWRPRRLRTRPAGSVGRGCGRGGTSRPRRPPRESALRLSGRWSPWTSR